MNKIAVNGHLAGRHWARRIGLELLLKMGGEPRNRAERRVLASGAFWSRPQRFDLGWPSLA